ncbi:MAG: OadG family protein [Nitrospinae bacterium]|nr:OadG family protein [Nitrospinota bacterium]
MSDFFSSIIVSVLALGVIFVALSTLILLIKVMVFLAPYKAPQKPQKKSPPAKSAPAAPAPAGAGPASPEQTAIIQSVLAHHLGRPPGDIHITNVKPL